MSPWGPGLSPGGFGPTLVIHLIFGVYISGHAVDYWSRAGRGSSMAGKVIVLVAGCPPKFSVAVSGMLIVKLCWFQRLRSTAVWSTEQSLNEIVDVKCLGSTSVCLTLLAVRSGGSLRIVLGGSWVEVWAGIMLASRAFRFSYAAVPSVLQPYPSSAAADQSRA